MSVKSFKKAEREVGQEFEDWFWGPSTRGSLKDPRYEKSKLWQALLSMKDKRGRPALRPSSQ